MVAPIRPKENAVVLKFGGGINSRASEDEIDERECASGQNDLLDLENREMKNRPPFDRVATAPNGSAINGFAQLLKRDGTTSLLVQAGTTVYETDFDTFTSVGSVSSGAKIRGRLEHNSLLDENVIITDLSLTDPVKEWDGTTFQNASFSGVTGAFKAKYCLVSKERAFFANVESNSTVTPHLIVGSAVEDYTSLTVANKPSSALGVGDAFHLVSPDLRPINGLVGAFGNINFSTLKGSIHTFTGSTAKDYAVQSLYERSGVDGDESLVYIGNDVAYGRQGAIDSLAGTDRYGDVETDDISKKIADSVSARGGWVSVYNSRLQKAYFFPSGENEVWVLNKPIRDAGLEISPWSKWTTNHSMAFQPTCVMNLLDPSTGLEYVFMGDSTGNIYRLEGTGSGDGGSASVKVERLSKLFSAPLDAQIYEIEGWIKHRKGDAATVDLKFEYAGDAVFTQNVTVSLPAVSGRPVYSGGLYYNNDNHYGTIFSGKLVREKFSAAGQSNEFQLRVTIEGTTDFQISEIGLRFREAS